MLLPLGVVTVSGPHCSVGVGNGRFDSDSPVRACPAVTFLRRQPAVNFNTPRGYAPLAIAAKYGRLQVVEALLSRGASVNFQCTTDGSTAIMQAAQVGQTAAVKMLCERGSNLLLKVCGVCPREPAAESEGALC